VTWFGSGNANCQFAGALNAIQSAQTDSLRYKLRARPFANGQTPKRKAPNGSGEKSLIFGTNILDSAIENSMMVGQNQNWERSDQPNESLQKIKVEMA
jgi:hypothetical protein